MRAVQVKHPGGPEVLAIAERPSPVPDRDEVLIEVFAASGPRNSHKGAAST